MVRLEPAGLAAQVAFLELQARTDSMGSTALAELVAFLASVEYLECRVSLEPLGHVGCRGSVELLVHVASQALLGHVELLVKMGYGGSRKDAG